MKRLSVAAICLIVGCCSLTVVAGRRVGKSKEISPVKGYQGLRYAESTRLRTILSEAINEVMKTYPENTFRPVEVAATIIDLRDPAALTGANIYGETKL